MDGWVDVQVAQKHRNSRARRRITDDPKCWEYLAALFCLRVSTEQNCSTLC